MLTVGAETPTASLTSFWLTLRVGPDGEDELDSMFVEGGDVTGWVELLALSVKVSDREDEVYTVFVEGGDSTVWRVV